LDPYKRLACAVIASAVRDYAIYHSDQAKKIRDEYRSLIRRNRLRDKPLNIERLLSTRGIHGSKRAHVEAVMGIQRDPGEFLFNDSPWHTLAGVDPERFKRLDFHVAYKTIRGPTTTFSTL